MISWLVWIVDCQIPSWDIDSLKCAVSMWSYRPIVILGNFDNLHTMFLVIFWLKDGHVRVFSRLHLCDVLAIKHDLVDVPGIFELHGKFVTGLEAKWNLEARPVIVDDALLKIMPTCVCEDVGCGRDKLVTLSYQHTHQQNDKFQGLHRLFQLYLKINNTVEKSQHLTSKKSFFNLFQSTARYLGLLLANAIFDSVSSMSLFK